MASSLIRRFREGIPAPHFQAKGAENVHGEDMWLDNDDIRPLKLADRTWNLWTYLTFWFSASEFKFGMEILDQLLICSSRHRVKLVRSIQRASSGSGYVGINRMLLWRSNSHRYRHCAQWTSGCEVSHVSPQFPTNSLTLTPKQWIPDPEQSSIWRIWCLVANFQSSCDGYCLERRECCPGWAMCLCHAPRSHT